jgi:short-subunit dehydrogenase
VNVVGPIAVTQAFLPLLRTAHGRVINMGSMSGRLASPLLGAYSASKFALEAISDALRIELSPWHIAVSIVEPGRIATPVWRKSRAVAEETLALAAPGGLELYGSTIAAGQAAAEAMSAGARSSDTVARVVAHALTTRRPRARYAVGWDARVEILLARFAPDRLRDWLIVSQLARYGRRRLAGKG